MTRASVKMRKCIRICCGEDFSEKICGCRQDLFFMEYNTEQRKAINFELPNFFSFLQESVAE